MKSSSLTNKYPAEVIIVYRNLLCIPLLVGLGIAFFSLQSAGIIYIVLLSSVVGLQSFIEVKTLSYIDVPIAEMIININILLTYIIETVVMNEELNIFVILILFIYLLNSYILVRVDGTKIKTDKRTLKGFIFAAVCAIFTTSTCVMEKVGFDRNYFNMFTLDAFYAVFVFLVNFFIMKIRRSGEFRPKLGTLKNFWVLSIVIIAFDYSSLLLIKYASATLASILMAFVPITIEFLQLIKGKQFKISKIIIYLLQAILLSAAIYMIS